MINYTMAEIYVSEAKKQIVSFRSDIRNILNNYVE